MAIILPDDPIAVAIIRAAQLDIPIVESPLGSNRSPEIDEMCREFGVPLGSPWCALWVAKCWKRGGAEIPPISLAKDWHPAKAETWRLWALSTNRFSHAPILGAAVLYGNKGMEPASHIGPCVVAIAPKLLAFEGNTSETGFSREGELTEMKRVNVDRLIGYIHPHPIAA